MTSSNQSNSLSLHKLGVVKRILVQPAQGWERTDLDLGTENDVDLGNHDVSRRISQLVSAEVSSENSMGVEPQIVSSPSAPIRCELNLLCEMFSVYRLLCVLSV